MSKLDKRILENKQIQLSIVIKLQELQRTCNENLTYEEIESYLIDHLWRMQMPNTLHFAVNDILSITADKLIRYLSVKAKKDSYKQNIADFEDFIGGK